MVSKRLPVDPIAEAKRQWIAHGWEEAAPGMVAVTSVMRAQQIMLSRVEASLRPFALSFARYELLALLSFTKDGRLPMSSAIRRLQVHPTSVTNTVQRLERDGLVGRSPHPDDGRATMLNLTDEGRRVAAEATAALNAEVFVAPGLATEDTGALTGILARFRRSAGDFDDPAPLPEPL
ncbi:MarR family winged helix-turn-helix transcriptional regulator [Agromyces sp. NPDC056389]|uniref:MarR family winged helix-turn-helix transcriptional regulator n=1 Tax=Agromyces sp. NPDC056389 TaxID=3345805 RepID=UPI0035D64C44